MNESEFIKGERLNNRGVDSLKREMESGKRSGEMESGEGWIER